jgi:hydrogenase maturation protease
MVIHATDSVAVRPQRITVVGFGNIRLGDCGLASTVLDALEQEPLDDGVCLAYLGENFQCLVEWLVAADGAVIVLPTRFGCHPGTIQALDLKSFLALAGPDDATLPYPRRLAASLALIQLAGLLPPDLRVMLVELFEMPDRVGLSRAMLRTARRVMAALMEFLASRRAIRAGALPMPRIYRTGAPAGAF